MWQKTMKAMDRSVNVLLIRISKVLSLTKYRICTVMESSYAKAEQASKRASVMMPGCVSKRVFHG